MTDRSNGSIVVQFAALVVLAATAVVGAFWWMRTHPPRAAAGPTPSSYTLEPRDAVTVPETETLLNDVVADPPEPDPTPAASDVLPALEDVISLVMPAVVTIQTGSSRGSGFFVTPDTLLTNVHVVGTNSTVTVVRPNGMTATASVQATEPAFDIAVLKIAGVLANQSVIELGSAANIRLGEEVIAIGTPLGFLQNTVSRGIVSGMREVRGATLVQTDAAINPGNSGGPLIDRRGTVIGIVTSAYVNSNGLAFAVSVDHVRRVLSGRSSTGSSPTAQTPYDALSPGVVSPEDSRRVELAQAYEDTIGRLSTRADGLDREWKSFVASCYQGRIAGGFERDWFALWDTRAMQGVVAESCVSYFNGIKRQATEIQQAVAATDETARQAGIYPGTRREMLRRYKLDYAGWGR
jgi:S1-C subfamily serine protease